MLYAVIFTDNPGIDPGLRAAHMADHLAFLERHAPEIRAAGPLAAPGGKATGGLWLVEADSVDRIEALVHADPFWPTGLRAGWSICEWRQVFADGTRRI